MQLCPPHLFTQTIQEMVHADNEHQLFNTLETAVHLLEFDYYAHGACTTYPVTRPTFTLKNNYPKSWQQRYSDNNYITIDPSVKHGLHSNSPINWQDDARQNPSEFWQEAAAFGLHSGWAQSSRLSPSTIGMLSVARTNGSKDNEVQSTTQPLLIWLNNVFESAYAEIVLPSASTALLASLTAREAEILKWCADGKTSEDIAMILNVTKRTVDFHTANAIEKLNVSNKTAAAVKGVQLNLL